MHTIISNNTFKVTNCDLKRKTRSTPQIYAPIDVETFRLSHDRFLCIDDDVYHIGASIKDLGKKWFGFSKMEILTPDELEERINRE